jgi:transcription initiation factor TFIIIB Brf1 subunit/transcription initiation factor TFIIB
MTNEVGAAKLLGIWTTEAAAVCRNCATVIYLGRADFERESYWTHDQNDRRECPGAPTADPVENSIQKRSPSPSSEGSSDE